MMRLVIIRILSRYSLEREPNNNQRKSNDKILHWQKSIFPDEPAAVNQWKRADLIFWWARSFSSHLCVTLLSHCMSYSRHVSVAFPSLFTFDSESFSFTRWHSVHLPFQNFVQLLWAKCSLLTIDYIMRNALMCSCAHHEMLHSWIKKVKWKM